MLHGRGEYLLMVDADGATDMKEVWERDELR